MAAVKPVIKELIRDIVIFDPNPDDNPNAANPELHRDHYLTHFPYDKRCPICRSCRQRKRDCRSSSDPSDPNRHAWVEPKAFGDLVTCDHKIVAEKNPENKS